MIICSIDVGIKNLAICILDVNKETKKETIVFWKCISLINHSESNTNPCKGIKQCCYDKCKLKTTKLYILPDGQKRYCKHHLKQDGYIDTKLFPKNIQKCNMDTLKTLFDEHQIKMNEKDPEHIKQTMKSTQKYTKTYYIQQLKKQRAIVVKDKKLNCKDFSLVDIGKELKKILDNEPIFKTVNVVLIENQISPIANKMKCIQGMITQYFIMRSVYDIHFISASNKLKLQLHDINEPVIKQNITKDQDKCKDKSISNKKEYKKRKNKGIEMTNMYLSNLKSETHENKDVSEYHGVQGQSSWQVYFTNHKKKDDLADCLLQGLWWIQKMENE